MSCMPGEGNVLYARRRRCLVWPDTVMSHMAGDGDVSYGRRSLLTLVPADDIQPYLYFHIYTGLVALLDRSQLSFSSITISTIWPLFPMSQIPVNPAVYHNNRLLLHKTGSQILLTKI